MTRRRRPGQAARDAANRALDELAREAYAVPAVVECAACFAVVAACLTECPVCETPTDDA